MVHALEFALGATVRCKEVRWIWGRNQMHIHLLRLFLDAFMFNGVTLGFEILRSPKNPSMRTSFEDLEDIAG